MCCRIQMSCMTWQPVSKETVVKLEMLHVDCDRWIAGWLWVCVLMQMKVGFLCAAFGGNGCLYENMQRVKLLFHWHHWWELSEWTNGCSQHQWAGGSQALQVRFLKKMGQHTVESHPYFFKSSHIECQTVRNCLLSFVVKCRFEFCWGQEVFLRFVSKTSNSQCN